MPPPAKGDNLTTKRHPEWVRHHIRWRWLLDSWEGGDVYRYAIYGYDQLRMPKRNLVRHAREYPPAREGVYQYEQVYIGDESIVQPTNDDYSLRLARTPVPTLVADGLESHLSRIFAQEINRETTVPGLKSWWEDVDGCGTSIDEWMAETIAPLLMVLGCLDIIVDHPRAPDDAIIDSKADLQSLGLDRLIAGYILPENMVWWELDDAGDGYAECLVCELQEDHTLRYRYWDADSWILYANEGEELDRGKNPFGYVPIKRIFDRKRPRYRNVGLPRYEAVAEIQREFYNRDSELILSDSVQAHPLIQGPEDFINSDGTLPIGPSWLLPKKKNTQGGSATYEGFDVIDFPKGAAESIRQNLAMLEDRADRSMALTKPAGAAGTTGSTVAQSGISKRLDQSNGNDLLSKIAAKLQSAEVEIAWMVCRASGDEGAEPTITYARSFDLMSAQELGLAIGEFQVLLQSSGQCPITEGQLLERLARLMLPGLDDATYVEIDNELNDHLSRKAEEITAQREGLLALTRSSASDGSTDSNPAQPGTSADTNLGWPTTADNLASDSVQSADTLAAPS